jgi:hypothetical protein
MGYPGNNVISGPISTTSQSDTYATHISELGKGGWRSVATEDDLNDIPTQRLEVGSAAYVWSDIASKNGLYLYLDNAWTQTSLNSTTYILPAATTSIRGGVIIKSGGAITLSGTNTDEIDVQTATTSRFGVVKLGTGLALDGNDKLYVTAANLTVKGPSYTGQSSPVLTFAGTAPKLNFNTTPDPDENTVTIDLPRYTNAAGDILYSPNLIKFEAGSNVSLTRTYSTTGDDNIYNLKIDISSNGTFKQNLYELLDVKSGANVTGSVETPTDGYVLKYSNADDAWISAEHNTGIQFSDLQANTPLVYDTTTNANKGTFSIPQATTSQNGFLSSGDFQTFSGKASWPTNPANNYANYYLGPVANNPSLTSPTYGLFKDSYLNEYSKSVRLVCRTASGQSVAAGDIVAVTTTSNSDGKPIVRKADSTFTNIIGIATEGKSANNDIVIMIEGIVSVDTTAYINTTGPVYATLVASGSGGYTLASSPTANSILVGYTIYNNSPGFFLIDIQQLASSGTYTLSVNNPAAASINLSQNGSGTITYTGNSGTITSLTLTGGRVGQRIPLRILQQATWNAGNTFTIAANWASGTAYTAGTRVRFEDSTDNTVAYYICTANVTSSTSPKADTTNWAKYITLPFGRDVVLSPYNAAEDVLMLNVTSTITVGTTVYPRIVIDTLYNV